ncbi:MFS transporter [Amycolatopsis sp. cg13]|uniref:MFS transporter n=1 Tax=Amycolatopsis sp. cg13 TaxID=3238807 RepID=UPI003525D74F
MIDLNAYRRVLSIPRFAAFLVLGLLLNLPSTAAPVVLTLYSATEVRNGNFGAAGLVVALWMAGMAIGSPLQGRLMDRRGLRPIFIAATMVHGAFWGCLVAMPFPVLAVAAFGAGMFVVSGGTITRLAVSALVPEDRSHTAFALSSMLTAFSVLLAPAAAVVIATQVSNTAAVVTVGAAFVLSGALLAGRKLPAEHSTSATAGGGARSILSAKLILVFACVAAVGVMTSGSDVALLATLKSAGQTAWAGAVMAVCAASSLLGGLAYGGRKRGWAPAPVVVAVGLFMLPIGIWADWRWLLVAFIPVASLISPAFSALAQVAGALAPSGSRAMVMSLFGTAVMAGNALGPPLAGLVYDHSSHQVSFVVIGGVGVLVGLLASRPLRGLIKANRPESEQPAAPAGEPVPAEAEK